MRVLHLLLLAILPLSLPSAVAVGVAGPVCASVDGDVDCDVAVSLRGSADGRFVAVSGTGEASTYMDYCLEWICPSVAVSAYDDARAECHGSAVCVAVAGRGHASSEGPGVAVGGCDLLFQVCYPVRALLLP
jgi:hypothetical protein